MNHINETAAEYFELKDQAKKIEDRLAQLRPILETHIKSQTGSLTGESNAAVTIQVGDYGLNLSPAKRDNYDYKKAIEELGEIAKPYLRHTWFTILKVTKVLKQDVA